jgi:hypothetical protein
MVRCMMQPAPFLIICARRSKLSTSPDNLLTTYAA